MRASLNSYVEADVFTIVDDEPKSVSSQTTIAMEKNEARVLYVPNCIMFNVADEYFLKVLDKTRLNTDTLYSLEYSVLRKSICIGSKA